MILTEAKLIGSALLLAGLVAGYAWFVHSERAIGAQQCRAEVSAATIKATAAARQTEANWQQDAATIEEVHAHELRDIAAQRDAALAGLRDHRAPRLPEAARSACHGATGAELSSRDASDLVGLAARADIVRADLAACQAWIGKVSGP